MRLGSSNELLGGVRVVGAGEVRQVMVGVSGVVGGKVELCQFALCQVCGYLWDNDLDFRGKGTSYVAMKRHRVADAPGATRFEGWV